MTRINKRLLKFKELEKEPLQNIYIPELKKRKFKNKY